MSSSSYRYFSFEAIGSVILGQNSWFPKQILLSTAVSRLMLQLFFSQAPHHPPYQLSKGAADWVVDQLMRSCKDEREPNGELLRLVAATM
eukprot:369290-Amphidinium_carterae.1